MKIYRNKNEVNFQRSIGSDQLDEMSNVASGGIRTLLAIPVIIFSVIGGCFPLVLAILHRWNWLAALNFVVMCTAAVVAFLGLRRKSNRLAWARGEIFGGWLLLLQGGQGA